MSNVSMSLILGLIFIFLLGCEKEEVALRPFPRLETLPVSEITDEGAVFNAKIFNRGDYEIRSFGFVWGPSPAPSLGDYFERRSEGQPDQTTFSQGINSGLKINKRYYVRAFLETTDHIVYGTEVTFSSLGSSVPILTAVTPETGSWGDTISVLGKFFIPDTTGTKAFLNEVELSTISISDSMAQFIIPPIDNDSLVTLRMISGGEAVQNNLSFKYEVVKILEVSPQRPTFLDTIKIRLANLNKEYYDFTVEGQTVAPISVFQDSIFFQYPLDVGTVNPLIRISSAGYESKRVIPLKEPELSKLRGVTIGTNDTLRVFGRDIYPVLEDNYLLLDQGIQIPLFDYRNDSLIFVMPDELPAKSVLTVKLVSGPFRIDLGVVNFEKPILFDLPTNRIEGFRPQLTFLGRNLTASGRIEVTIQREERGSYLLSQEQIQIVSSDQLQIELGESLFEDPLVSTRENIILRISAGGRVIRAYGLQLRYSSIWTKGNGMEFWPNPAGLSFPFGKSGYIGNGFEDGDFIVSFYLYDSELSSWERYWSGTNIKTIAYPVVFTINDQAYMATGTRVIDNGVFKPNAEVYTFDINSLTWNRLADFPGRPRYAADVMIHQAAAYLLGGQNDSLSILEKLNLAREIWKFDPVVGSWTKLDMALEEKIINTISVSGQGYISVEDGFYRFTETGWTKIDIPNTINLPPIALGESAFWGFENALSDRISTYDFSTGQFKSIVAKLPKAVIHQYLFTIDGLAYFAVLREGNREIWSFDPSKL